MQVPASSRNWISISGVVIALFSLINIIMLFFVSLLMDSNPYVGIILYLVLPGILILGLLLIPVGMWLHRKEKDKKDKAWPRIDLNLVQHRNAALIFIIGTVIFVFLSVFGAYEAFHFSESVEFCGTTCHSVMEPEYVAYQKSAHARVACVDCHVGDGAGWYVKSKLSGMYQVYAVLADVYPTPIPTPIHNLRPARETCETCHWPQKFYTRKLRHEVYYLGDGDNTRWTLDLMMKIGGKHQTEGLEQGIHWHVNPDVKVEYVSDDERLQSIPWVRYTNLKTGEVSEYFDEENEYSPEEIAGMELHTMDCMSCHNRPSHSYTAPTRFINAAITAGEIDAAIPEIKKVLTNACGATYPDRESAHEGITAEVLDYYRENYPDLYSASETEISSSVAAALAVYDQNVFPTMGARWDAYPAFIGHMESDGCFRCHNGTHVNSNDEYIRRDCDLCHTIQGQGTEENWEEAGLNQTLEFSHPVDIYGAWEEMLCSDCHDGLVPEF